MKNKYPNSRNVVIERANKIEGNIAGNSRKMDMIASGIIKINGRKKVPLAVLYLLLLNREKIKKSS